MEKKSNKVIKQFYFYVNVIEKGRAYRTIASTEEKDGIPYILKGKKLHTFYIAGILKNT